MPEVEQNAELDAEVPFSGAVAALASTYGVDMPSFLRINGTKASLELTNAYSYSGARLRSLRDNLHVDMTTPGDTPSQFLLEADHFADCIRNGTEPRTPGEEGLKDMLAIEAIYKAAGTPIA